MARRAAPTRTVLKGGLLLETPLGALLSDSRVRLLEAIDRQGSLNRAAGEVPLSYKAAWDTLQAMNALAAEPLVTRSTGGRGGGGTRLTDHARQLIALYRAMESSQQDVLDRLPALPSGSDEPAMRTLIRRLTMRSSARNQFAAEVAGWIDRGGAVDVALDLVDDGLANDRITATITPESLHGMGLRVGSPLYALIKAPWIGVQARPARAAPGRNVLATTITARRPGTAHTGISLALRSGRVMQASVPPGACEGLAVGGAAWAVFDTESVVLVSFA